MPELPDITIYVEALRRRILHQPLERARIVSPFILRTFDPPIDETQGRSVTDIRRLGKRIVLCLDNDLLIVIHLMIAGRLRWLDPTAKPPGKISLAAFDFASGALVLTEAGPKKRASLHVVRGEAGLRLLDPGGLEILDANADAFRDALRRENHTLKRSLTDPRLFSGIGNAYSDEILHAARLSPIALTAKLTDDEIDRLHAATQSTLTHWIDNLRQQFGDRFPGPGEITAFRPDFAVHGRFGEPCPACATTVQRIRYAENETNYCPRCQTGGRILADRSLSRLLRDDWPRTIEQLEAE
jgi:formamidopyrimidine-DNA glycosylase